MGFNQHRADSRGTIPSRILAMESLPIPYSITDFGLAQLALWRAMERAQVAVCDAQTNSETQSPRQ